MRYEWSKLNHLQLGKYAEYLIKMEFTQYSFDVYTAEVDDKGIDFILRKEQQGYAGEVEYKYYDVQVKSVRGMNYIFFSKEKFRLRENLLAAITIFRDGEQPELYIIPSPVWSNPSDLFVSRDYEGLKSKPEWGLNLSRRNLALLEPYRFEHSIEQL